MVEKYFISKSSAFSFTVLDYLHNLLKCTALIALSCDLYIILYFVLLYYYFKNQSYVTCEYLPRKCSEAEVCKKN